MRRFQLVYMVCPLSFWSMWPPFLIAGEGSSTSFLSFLKGDLIILEQENGEALLNSGSCFGLCDRTEKQGVLPTEYLYLLPTMTKPPPDVLVSTTPLARSFKCRFPLALAVCNFNSRKSVILCPLLAYCNKLVV